MSFGSYMGIDRGCFLQKRTIAHFDNYCRGLLSDLPRKSIEPIALASGTAVRTPDPLGTIGTIGTIGVSDETSCVKKGDQTPGMQRQYLGCVGKIDNQNGVYHLHHGTLTTRRRNWLNHFEYPANLSTHIEGVLT